MATAPGGVEVGRVSVRVVPDTSHMMGDLKAKLEALESEATFQIRGVLDTSGIGTQFEQERQKQERDPITVPTRAATDQLAASIRAEALKLSKSVQVDIPLTAEGERMRQDIAAQVKLIEELTTIEIPADLSDAAELRAKMAVELDLLKLMAEQAKPKVTIETGLDEDSLAKTEAEIGAISRLSTLASGGISSLAGSFSVAGIGASGLLLALGPMVVALTAATAALAAPLAVTAGGLTIFGFLAGFAVTNTLKQIKTINTLDTKLSSLTKGTATYKTTLAQLQAAQAALTPAQAAFANALNVLKGAMSGANLQGALLKPLTDGMRLLAAVIPDLTPVVKVVSNVLDQLVGQLNAAVKSPGFKGFVNAFAHQLGPDMRAFATIAKNVLVGVLGLFGALNNQLSGGVLKGLENITGAFAKFGQDAGENKGLRSFVDYVKAALPPAGKIIGDAFSIIGGALAAVAPAALGLEKLLAGVLDALKNIGPLATPLAAALAGIFLPFIGGPEVGLVLGLAAAFKEVYDRCLPLQRLVNNLATFFKTQLLPIIEQAAGQILPAISAAIKDIGQTIQQNKGFLQTFGKLILVFTAAAVVTAILAIAGAIRGIGLAFKFGVTGVHLFVDSMISLLSVGLKALGVFVQAVLDQFGHVVDGAAAAFGWLPGIGGKVKAAQSAFHSFTANVVGGIDDAAKGLDNLKQQIDAIGQKHPRFKVTVDDLQAISHLQALQEFRLKDKTLNVNLVERAVGTGGGIGIPGGVAGQDGTASGTGSGAPRTASGGNPKALINVENMHVTDANDILRKTQKQRVSKAGGGVHLRPGPAFVGAP